MSDHHLADVYFQTKYYGIPSCHEFSDGASEAFHSWTQTAPTQWTINSSYCLENLQWRFKDIRKENSNFHICKKHWIFVHGTRPPWTPLRQLGVREACATNYNRSKRSVSEAKGTPPAQPFVCGQTITLPVRASGEEEGEKEDKIWRKRKIITRSIVPFCAMKDGRRESACVGVARCLMMKENGCFCLGVWAWSSRLHSARVWFEVFTVFALVALESLISGWFVCGVVNNTFVVCKSKMNAIVMKPRWLIRSPDVCVTLTQISPKDLRGNST